MRFALVDNKKVEAKTGLIANCPGCSQSVIPKCGDQRLHHWAHSRNKMCDTWWEPETEWHRTWKNNYPADWQEISLFDERTGEKHIADVRTIHNLYALVGTDCCGLSLPRSSSTTCNGLDFSEP